jgi:LCP family protein required for cell wall assembly
VDEPTPDGGTGGQEQPSATPPEQPSAATAERPRGWAGRTGLVVGRTVVVLASAAALAVAGVAWFGAKTVRADTNTTPALVELSAEPNQPPRDDGATDILLVGSDDRTDVRGNPLPESVLKLLRTQYDAGLNTDTIMLLRVPKNGGRAYAVSIPRDTYVTIPGYQDDKINSAYGVLKSRAEHQLEAAGQSAAAADQQSSVAGQKALIETVQNLTGAHVDHYVEVNLYGFYLLSKAIGGVDVCLRHATSDSDSGADFPAGKQTVFGGAALSFVRQRKNLPDGDLSRIVRQQVFLASAVHKVLSAGTLTSPSALSGLLDAMGRSLVTDPGMDLPSLVQQAVNLTSGNVEFVTIPVVNDNARSPRGQSIVQVDPGTVQQFVASLSQPPAPSSAAPPSAQPSSAQPSSAQPSSAQPPNVQPSTSAGARPTTATATATPATTVTTPPPASTGHEPTPPVSVDGIPCVD